MSTPWFVKYNLFISQNQKEKAGYLLLYLLKKESRDPLVYIISFRFFTQQKEFALLRRVFYKALFFFPSSLFVKEVLTFLSIRYFSYTKRTAFILSEYIIPEFKLPSQNFTKLYYWVGQYFYKRKILDSALLYAHMACYYNINPSQQYFTFLGQANILVVYKNQINLRNFLQNEVNIWKKNLKVAPFLFKFLLKNYILYLTLNPEDTQKINLEKTIDFFVSNSNKNWDQYSKNKNIEIKNKLFFHWAKKILFILLIIVLLFYIYSKLIGSTSHSI